MDLRIWRAIAILSIARLDAAVQSNDPPPRFEVASIRQCVGTDRPSPGVSSPGRLNLPCWPLRRIIQEAYDVFAAGKVDPLNPSFPLTPLEGGPDWMNSARFTILATTPLPESPAMMRGPLMRKLLEERFGLQIHRETRDVPVYLMTIAADGPKMQPTKPGSCKNLDPLDLAQRVDERSGEWCVVTPPASQGSRIVWDVKGMSMPVLARLMNPGRPVLDRTGLTGTFDIHLEWWKPESLLPPEEAPAAASPAAPLLEAMRKQLGLRFEPGRGPREFLVIDHLERPTGN